ncbi:MAG: hypothetical protein WDN02_11945 [Methylovirgula sp.]|uniref:hypothetical protein n=1 Tax=Methylovirgula sp. TaxID=1978224 RepID=UPI00307637A8
MPRAHFSPDSIAPFGCSSHLDQPVISIPSQALIFNKNGLSAAVYEDGVVHIRKLTLLADNGAEVDVRTGLKPDDMIIP